jgi:hypothetical protein
MLYKTGRADGSLKHQEIIMSIIKENLLDIDLEEHEYEAIMDKIGDSIYCTSCGNSPQVWPTWIKENYYAGKCNSCDDKYAEFYLDPGDRSDV